MFLLNYKHKLYQKVDFANCFLGGYLKKQIRYLKVFVSISPLNINRCGYVDF